MAQTQEEVENLIDALIIDNTTRVIDPARVRQVLKAINARVPIGSDPNSLNTQSPLALNPSNGNLSISQASSISAGYLSASDWVKFNTASESVPVVANKIVLFAKGFAGGSENIASSIEKNDICVAFLNTNPDFPTAGTFGFFQYGGSGDDQDISNYVPVDSTAVNIT